MMKCRVFKFEEDLTGIQLYYPYISLHTLFNDCANQLPEYESRG